MEYKRSWRRGLVRRLLVAAGSVGLTSVCFLVLPLIQAIGQHEPDMVQLTDVDTAQLPPPPPQLEEPELEPEPEPEQPPPDLLEEARPLDLAQLEAALGAGSGSGWSTADFALDLGQSVLDKALSGDMFELSGVDQPPRVRSSSAPILSGRLQRRLKQGAVRVILIFVVDLDGRVKNPRVEDSSDPNFNKAALSAIKRWRFEPAKRNGEDVAFPTRQPITFPKG